MKKKEKRWLNVNYDILRYDNAYFHETGVEQFESRNDVRYTSRSGYERSVSVFTLNTFDFPINTYSD